MLCSIIYSVLFIHIYKFCIGLAPILLLLVFIALIKQTALHTFINVYSSGGEQSL